MQITQITTSTFTYFDADADADLYICASCAADNPDLTIKPATYTYNLVTDAFPSLCHYCHDPIIDIA